MTPRKPGVCLLCGKDREPGRTKYCSEACASVALANREKKKREDRLTLCRRCGGKKELGTRGGKYCEPCRQVIADSSAQHERERYRRRRAKLVAEGVLEEQPPTYIDGHKWCPRCRDYRPLASFPPRDGGAKRAPYCRPCQRAYNSERRLRQMFGLDWDEYDLLLMTQDGRCAICNGKPRKYALAVDHDHKTGEIRGLLCSRCNHGLLGSANEDPARLRKAADYLEAYGPREVFGEPRYVPGSNPPGDAA